MEVGTIMKITLDITAKDFDHLTSMQMRWAGTDWKEKDGRFDTIIPQTEIDYGWLFAFWCENYSDYLLAAAYLKSIAEPHQALFDGATGDIAILTDYAATWSD